MLFGLPTVLLVIVLITILILWFYPWSKRQYVKSLVRQYYRWYIASTQDNHPLIKNLHANYAVGYVSAIADIASANEVLAITGLDLTQMQKQATKEQDAAMATMAKQCPDLIPDDPDYKKYLKNVESLHE